MNNALKGIALFFGGAVAGAAVALMLTPKNGEEIRKELRDLAEEAKKRADDFCEQVKTEILAKCPGHACEAPAVEQVKETKKEA